MPHDLTNKINLTDYDSFYRDEADKLQKCLQMNLLFKEKKQALTRSEKRTIAVHLSEEQLEFLENCINTEICNTVSFYDEDIEEEFQEDDEYETDMEESFMNR
jgi:hypothetical protein